MLQLTRSSQFRLLLFSSALFLLGCTSDAPPEGNSDGGNPQSGDNTTETATSGDPATPDSTGDSERIVFETEWGNIVARIDLKHAPVTSREFLEHVRAGHLDDSSFYRTVTLSNQPGHPTPIEVIQGGRLPWIEGADPDYPGFPHETTADTGLLHLDGTLSMARDEPGSATTEFFICIGAQPELDFGGARNPDGQGFAAFGQVIDGMDVVRRIHQANESEQRLEPKIRISRVYVH